MYINKTATHKVVSNLVYHLAGYNQINIVDIKDLKFYHRDSVKRVKQILKNSTTVFNGWISASLKIKLIDGSFTFGRLLKNKNITFIYSENFIIKPTSIVYADHPDFEAELVNLLKMMRVYIGINKILKSHYDYLDLVIEPFSKLLKDLNLTKQLDSGFIVAHGDKCYSLMSDFTTTVERGRIAMLYLLTYTDLMDLPRHQYRVWVKTNYNKYLPLLRKAEKLSVL
jgi:hypothetical protein